MAIYYIDTSNFDLAESVWENELLTDIAADGFYNFDGYYREQADGVLGDTFPCNESPLFVAALNVDVEVPCSDEYAQFAVPIIPITSVNVIVGAGIVDTNNETLPSGTYLLSPTTDLEYGVEVSLASIIVSAFYIIVDEEGVISEKVTCSSIT